MIPMITCIRNVSVYAPEPKGVCDLYFSDRIEYADSPLKTPVDPALCRSIDGSGLTAVPGFVDPHVHVTGGGGEGGFASRTPELSLGDIICGGVTTVVGTLGTDGVTRSLQNLLAKCRGLQAEGLSAWCYTGSYRVPVRTMTGGVMDDIILIERVIGAGEIAVSDHRSSQPALHELTRLAADARVGGILSGKAGVVNIHMGDGPRMLDLLKQVTESTEIPRGQFIPTHMNRNQALFAAGLEWGRAGGRLDYTTSTTPQFLEEGEEKCSSALRKALEAGIPIDRITFSSDGGGSLPAFDKDGEYTGLTVGTCKSLFPEVRDAVLQEGIPLEDAIRVITSSPARALKLPGKGSLAEGSDADIVLLDAELNIRGVFARGREMVRHGEQLVFGTFETPRSLEK